MRKTSLLLISLVLTTLFINNNLVLTVSSESIGWELLDDGNVLRMWNVLDSYFFNVSSGIQFSNHYQEYWSHNILGIGYYAGGEWNLLYWTDSLSSFERTIETDWNTYVNATLWKDLSSTIEGTTYEYRLALRYHLKTNDPELTVQPYIKNIGSENINADIGFAWRVKDIKVSNNSIDDKAYLAWVDEILPNGDFVSTGESYFLNETIDKSYLNSTHPFLLGYQVRDETTWQVLETWWTGHILDRYLLKIKSLSGQYNAPITLYINAGSLAVGQEKTTTFLWHDADLIDSYSEVNQDTENRIRDHHPSDSAYESSIGQSFTNLAAEYKITSAKFYARKVGSPTGNFHAVLYAHSGTYGTNSEPTGSALGTSDAYDVSTFDTSLALVTFTFTGAEQYTMSASTYYCIDFQAPSSGTFDTSNYVKSGRDGSSPSHGGNMFWYVNGDYSTSSSIDLCFYVYGETAGDTYYRSITQSVSWSSSINRVWTLTRQITQSISWSGTVYRTWSLTRALTQSLSFVWDAYGYHTLAGAGASFYRAITMTLTFVWDEILGRHYYIPSEYATKGYVLAALFLIMLTLFPLIVLTYYLKK